jgi:hypothetical protein
MDHQAERLVDIVYGNGRKCRTTLRHSFLTSRGWVTAGDLSQGDVLLSGDRGSPDSLIVTAVEKSSDVVPVFNLITEPNYTFSADGLVAHTFTRARTVRVLLWTARRAVMRMVSRVGALLRPTRPARVTSIAQI